jgi:ankyrin repeat protein
MHLAAEKGAADIVRELLAAHANPNPKDKDGKTPLMHAAACGRVEVIEILLNDGVDIEERDSLGYTAICHAVSGAKPKAVRVLLDRGASPSVVTSIVQDVVTPETPARYHDWTPLQLVDAALKSAEFRCTDPRSRERHAKACAAIKEMLLTVGAH